MITERDLDEAIAECMGQRNPNSNTCIKLAAYLIIKDHLIEPETVIEGHSYAREDKSVDEPYESGTELSEAAQGLSLPDIMSVFDELMDALRVLNRPLYEATLRKLRAIE